MKPRTNPKRPLMTPGELLAAALSATLALVGGASLRARQVSAASLGSLDVTVRIAPSAGNAEPARGLPLSLLRKSFEDIRKEADSTEPALDKDAFIEKQDLTPDCKAWMRKHQIVDFSSKEFPRTLTVEDILDIKEFADAFSLRTKSDLTLNMPSAKYLKVDQKKNPEKYQQLLDQYHAGLKTMLAAHPDVLDDMHTELELVNINPGAAWHKLELDRDMRVHRRTLELAGNEYLVAQSTTDLEGRCSFANVAPGNYWVSSLEIQAASGDTRVRWDFPVRLAPGQSASVQLNSLNGIAPTQ